MRLITIAVLSAAIVSTTAASCASNEPSATQEREPQELAYKAAQGPFDVGTAYFEWTDGARSRVVPVKLYRPTGATGALPLVVFSHGGGGTREGSTFLCDHLASHGYAVMTVEHEGSNRDALGRGRARPRALMQALDAIVSDSENWSLRPQDVRFAIDRALAGDLGIAVDPTRIAVAGHSYGAYTAMATAGMLVDLPGGEDTSFRDERVRAVVALSPQGIGQFGISVGAWDKIEAPIMMMTGTEDSRPGKPWTWRRQAFDALNSREDAPPAYLSVIDGAGHMAFSDERNRRFGAATGGQDPRFHGWIQQLSVATLDAHLLGDEAARQWLRDASIERLSSGAVSLEATGR